MHPVGVPVHTRRGVLGERTPRAVAADALQEEGRDPEADLLRSGWPVKLVSSVASEIGPWCPNLFRFMAEQHFDFTRFILIESVRPPGTFTAEVLDAWFVPDARPLLVGRRADHDGIVSHEVQHLTFTFNAIGPDDVISGVRREWFTVVHSSPRMGQDVPPGLFLHPYPRL